MRDVFRWRRAKRPASNTVRIGLTVVVAAGLLVTTVVSGEANDASPARVPQVGLEVPVTATDRGPTGPANNSPMLVVDPTEPDFVVLANRLDAPDFSCALQLSGDGGTGWITVDPVPELPDGAEKCYAPEVAFDSQGVLYYLFVGLHGRGNEPMGVFLTTSADRGQSFSSPRRVLDAFNFGVRMRIDRTGRTDRLHLVWLHANSDPPLGGLPPPPNPIMTAYSDDGGRTFSKPVQVNADGRMHVVAPALDAADGIVHVAYYDLHDDVRDYKGLEGPVWDGAWSLIMASSFDGGKTFRSHTVVDSEIRPHERVMLIFTMAPPALAVGPGGRVCLAWTDARNGDADILGRCSSNRGKTWLGLARLNDDPIGNGRTQYLPALDVSPTGRLDAVFYDRRDDPKDVLNDIYYTFALDGDGREFSDNLKLTGQSFESRIGQQYINESAAGQYEFGSRLALWSDDDGVLAAWTDTRNSSLLRGATGQDIFAAAVLSPPVREGGTWSRSLPLAAGAVLLVVISGVGVWVSKRRKSASAWRIQP